MKPLKLYFVICSMMIGFLVTTAFAQVEEETRQGVLIGGLGIDLLSGFPHFGDLLKSKRGPEWLAIESGYTPHLSVLYLPRRNLFVYLSAGVGFMKSSYLDTVVPSGAYRYRIRYVDQVVQTRVLFLPFSSSARFVFGLVGITGLHYTTEKHYFESTVQSRSVAPGYGLGFMVGFGPGELPITFSYYRLRRNHLIQMSILYPLKVLKKR